MNDTRDRRDYQQQTSDIRDHRAYNTIVDIHDRRGYIRDNKGYEQSPNANNHHYMGNQQRDYTYQQSSDTQLLAQSIVTAIKYALRF